VLELKAKRNLEEVKQEMTIFATSEDLGKAFKKINDCAKTREIEEMENRVTPLVEQAVEMLETCTLENGQIKEMIRRFDEVISEKVNKVALEQYSKDANGLYVTAANFHQQTQAQAKTSLEIKREISDINKQI
jgi:hypothetical protein